MKKLIKLSIITLLFISCSNDDNPIDSVDNEKSLIKMIQTRFDNGALDEMIEFEYKDNKPLKTSFYNSENELMGYTDWLYNDKKLLASTKNYLPDGTLQSQSVLTYDGKNRIIQKDTSDDEGKYKSINNFTHNNDNTITANAISGTYESTKTFHINADGLIYKETVANKTTIEVIYDGNNPTSIITSYGTSTYTYDELNSRKGIFFNQYNTIFGENKINPILWGYYLEDQVGSNADKYQIKQKFSNGHIEENKYIFGSDGYPLSMKRYYNDELTDEMEYVYD